VRPVATLRASRGPRRKVVVGLLLAWILAAPLVVSAQDSIDGVHCAFSSLLGTGVYRINSERSAFVLEIPARYTVSRSKYGQNGERRIGLEVRAPLTVGLLRGNNIEDFVDQDVYGTVTITPGLEAEVPLAEWWLVRPFFSVGWGTELGPDREPDLTDPANPIVYERGSALIYQAGFKTRFALPAEAGNWGLLGALRYAGYKPNDGRSADLLLIMGGVETRQRLGSYMNGNYALFVEAHASYSYVADLAELRKGEHRPIAVDDFWEVGLAVSQGVVPFRVFRIPIERFGLAFQMSTDREFRAVKLSFRSPFRR
jgi:hypothetical protein